jgi:hypothetical protein
VDFKFVGHNFKFTHRHYACSSRVINSISRRIYTYVYLLFLYQTAHACLQSFISWNCHKKGKYVGLEILITATENLSVLACNAV